MPFGPKPSRTRLQLNARSIVTNCDGSYAETARRHGYTPDRWRKLIDRLNGGVSRRRSTNRPRRNFSAKQ